MRQALSGVLSFHSFSLAFFFVKCTMRITGNLLSLGNYYLLWRLLFALRIQGKASCESVVTSPLSSSLEALSWGKVVPWCLGRRLSHPHRILGGWTQECIFFSLRFLYISITCNYIMVKRMRSTGPALCLISHFGMWVSSHRAFLLQLLQSGM